MHPSRVAHSSVKKTLPALSSLANTIQTSTQSEAAQRHCVAHQSGKCLAASKNWSSVSYSWHRWNQRDGNAGHPCSVWHWYGMANLCLMGCGNPSFLSGTATAQQLEQRLTLQLACHESRRCPHQNDAQVEVNIGDKKVIVINGCLWPGSTLDIVAWHAGHSSSS